MKKEHTSTKQTASHPDSEARFRNIVENLNDVIYILNERAEITYITPNIESTSGYSVSDVTGKRFTDFVHPDDLPERMERFENAFSGTSEATEYRLVNKFGDVVWVRNSARPVIQDGTVVGVQGVLTDITERKEYEERLQQQFSYSEALNRILDIIISQDISDESLNDIIGIMGKTLQLDRALIYQIRLEEQLAVGLCEWLNPDCPEAKPTMGIYPLQAFGQWSAHMLETKRYLESHHDDIHPKLSESGSSGMITLQTEFFNDQKSADEVLQVTQSRIKSMALVHELVYENNNFAEIHIGKLLQRLVDNLEEIYNPGDKEISVDVRTEDFMLNMNDSIPFSLLVNEVVTNAYKHAFQDRDSGKIEITLDRKNGLCHVSIADNGIGLSDTAHIENPQSLGYTIINGLVNQLNGALAFRTRGAGLCLELTFPLNETDHAKT